MPNAEKLLEHLDESQRLVATTFGAPVLVRAGAGAGKTRAITYRLAYGAKTGQIDPAKTLAVTFTTRAAGELKQRLVQLGVAKVQTRTFHSAALRIAKYFWPIVYGNELPEVNSNKLAMVAAATRQIVDVDDEAVLKDLSAEISWAKSSNVTPEAYPKLATSQARLINQVTAEQVSQILRKYEEVKKHQGCIDFDDILLCNIVLLDQNSEVRQQVSQRYQFFVVDEFQDLTAVQYRLLQYWLDDREDICVVGDPKQSIHGFAGASPRYFNKFLADHPATVEISMNRNYRSTKTILDFANQLIPNTDEHLVAGKEVTRLNSELADITCRSFLSDYEQAQEVGQWLQELHKNGVEWREMAVLYRVHSQSGVLESVLSSMNIDYRVKGDENFYQRKVVKQAIKQIELAAGKLAAAESASGQAAVAKLDEVLARFGWEPQPPESSISGQIRQRWESLSALRQMVLDELATRPETTFAQIALMLSRAQAVERPTTLEAVTLTTMHAAKGLEWDAVALYGVDDQNLPFIYAKTPEQLAEEKRLLYVGLTRAKKYLKITWCASANGGRKISRFLADILAKTSTTQSGLGENKTRHWSNLNSDTAANRAVKKPGKRSVFSYKCKVCGQSLTSGSEILISRHLDCQASYRLEVLEALTQWRSETAKKLKYPDFVIFTDATLIAIAENNPATISQLAGISGVGMAKANKYGTQILKVLTG